MPNLPFLHVNDDSKQHHTFCLIFEDNLWTQSRLLYNLKLYIFYLSLSFVEQLIDLIFYHLKTFPAWKHPRVLLCFLQFILTLTIVGIRKFCMRVAIAVAFIVYEYIVTASKHRAVALVSANQILVLLGHKFLPHVHGEDIGSTAVVWDPSTIGIPGIVSIPAKYLPWLILDKKESVLLSIAVLVEGSSSKAVLWCPEYQIGFLDYIQIVHNFIEKLSLRLV